MAHAELAHDADLLGRIAARDFTALGELYDRHSPVLLAVAHRILRERSEAEDVVHDAFVVLVDRASQYVDERGTVGGWLITMVRNLSIDRARRRNRRAEIVRDAVTVDRDVVPTPEDVASEERERQAIRRALFQLPEAQRVTLEIAFYEGLSYPEIAAQENVPLGTIKSRAARAMATLRELLEKDGIRLHPAGSFANALGELVPSSVP